jgi:hypothetical protein
MPTRSMALTPELPPGTLGAVGHGFADVGEEDAPLLAPTMLTAALGAGDGACHVAFLALASAHL